ncbi:unnamed protein product [Didymodactylos carnosus]|uniref:C2H2-type domain-containing protein n=1 Tax=Didymodactylos carnosus TaxID=1234261 RepID=A0A813WG77_9BILA|nr:unnamed protein product [Didymodactylos carnosus]CAF1161673.1 unnamed protein product [Didymodactylos carnosus]CAF3642260.1 unnamed protein product [Didymodactylos carnosus]CAF3973398.1 unnamed protein product [Didymodactylos carnosus]
MFVQDFIYRNIFQLTNLDTDHSYQSRCCTKTSAECCSIIDTNHSNLLSDAYKPKIINDLLPDKHSSTITTISPSVNTTSSSLLENLSERRHYHACTKCLYKTNRLNNLKRHISTMHQTLNRPLDCCGQQFENKALLREHITNNHRRGYSCLICFKSFCRKALLKRHQTVHTGEKEFTCNMCNYATSHRGNLDRHSRVHLKRVL